MSAGLLQEGGIATSSKKATGNQWDGSNAWPPLQAIIIEGLHTHGGLKGQQHAAVLAQLWLSSNLMGWRKYGQMVCFSAALPMHRVPLRCFIMIHFSILVSCLRDEESCCEGNEQKYCQLQFEKLDAERPGEPGGHGEYKVQTGFGWSNGVVLQLLSQSGWHPEVLQRCRPWLSQVSL